MNRMILLTTVTIVAVQLQGESLLLNRMILLTTVTIVAVQLQGGVFIIEQYDIVVLPFIIGAV